MGTSLPGLQRCFVTVPAYRVLTGEKARQRRGRQNPPGRAAVVWLKHGYAFLASVAETLLLR